MKRNARNFSTFGKSARRLRFRHRQRLLLEWLETRLAPANVDVLTYHYDSFLSGNNNQETDLNLTNVNARDFGKLFSQAVDGQIYATPLYKANLQIAGGTHNVVFIATEHDSVYAFDADTGAALWAGGKRSFIDPANGITSVPSTDTSTNVAPEYGITGTPVIDADTSTMYVVAQTKEVRGTDPHYVDKLYAIDITTGLNRPTNAVVTIGDSIRDTRHDTLLSLPGHGDDAFMHEPPDGVLKFNAFRQLQRPALTLANGNVYIAFAGYNDQRPYHGWVVGYRTNDLEMQGFFCDSPNAQGGGIWQSGGGLGTDAAGNLYFASGNTFGLGGPKPGFSPDDGNYGETVLKLSTAGGKISVLDYFTPYNWLPLDNADLDLGSGGTMLLPDYVGSPEHRHLMVETGKTGRLYLIDRDNMGQNDTAHSTDHVVQTLELGGPGIWGNPGFLQVNDTTGIIYYHGNNSDLKAIQISNAALSAPIGQSNLVFGYPGGQPILSSNGTKDAIAWDLRVDGFSGATVLYAYNAIPDNRVLTELYNSTATSLSTGASLRDRAGGPVKFTAATETNGHVLVGSSNSVSVYGLFDAHAKAPADAPTKLATPARTDTSVTLTWANPSPNDFTGIRIERSLTPNPADFSEIAIIGRNDTSFVNTGLSAATQYYYRIRGTNQAGNGPYSDIAPVATRIPAPVLASGNVSRAEIDLSWTQSGDDHYQVERSFNDQLHFMIIAPSIPAAQTTYFDTDPILVTQRGTYYYRVTSFNQNPPDTALSNEVAVSNTAGIDHSAPPSGGFLLPVVDVAVNGNAQFTRNLVQLTANLNNAGTVFTNRKVGIDTFTTSFTFRIHDGSEHPADGLTFVLQNNSSGALGGNGGGLGYGGIGNSIAVKFDMWTQGTFHSSTGLFFNGNLNEAQQIDMTGSGVDLVNANVKQVDLSYDGTTLHETIRDTVTGAHFDHDYTVNIPAVIGDDAAYAGFGGGTGGAFAIQDIQTWAYTPGTGKPGAPTGAVAVVGTSDVNLSWKSNSINEDGFRIERSDNGQNNFREIATPPPTAPRFHDTNLSPGNYYYRVRAFNAQGNSVYSNVVNAPVGPVSPFADHSAGFASHSDLTNNGQSSYVGTRLRLTQPLDSQIASVWTNTQVGVFSFTTSFVVQTLARAPDDIADGLTFALQRDTRGTGAIGGGGGSLAYNTITPSVAVMFDIWTNNSHRSTTKVLTNGSTDRAGAIDLTSAGITFATGHPMKIDIAYDGTVNTLVVTETDTVTGTIARQTYGNLNIPSILGGSTGTAFAGFTAATGGQAATMDILNWSARFMDPVQPLNHLGVSAAGNQTAGAPFALTVSAVDGFNRVKPEYRGTVHFTSSDPQAVLPSDTTFQEADRGVKMISGVVLKTGGSQTITARDTVTGTLQGSFTVNVAPAAASLFIVSYPTQVTAGVSGTLAVTAKDPYGNTATGYRGTVHFTSTDPQAALPADTTLTNGTGSFSATLKTAGTQSITARDTVDGTILGSQSGIVVSANVVTHFLVAGFAQRPDAGDIGAFMVAAKDDFGNTNPNYRGTVHFSSTDGRATLEDDYTFTGVDQGVHYSAVILFTAGTQSIIATDTADGTIVGRQDNIQVRPLVASQFAFIAPSQVQIGNPFPFTLIAEDRYGNVANDPERLYTGTVTFSSTDETAFLPFDYTFTAADNGRHEFAAVLLRPGVQTITASDTADPTIVGSVDITVVGGDAPQGSGEVPVVTTAVPPAAPTGATLSGEGAPQRTGQLAAEAAQHVLAGSSRRLTWSQATAAIDRVLANFDGGVDAAAVDGLVPARVS